MSYLIHKNELIAKTHDSLKSGVIVLASREVRKEAINASRDYNLVNAIECKVSNAKKWESVFQRNNVGYASLLNSDGMYPEYRI